MRLRSILCGLLFAHHGFASTTLETKVCTVYHDDKATNCFTAEPKSYPTGVLYGVSKIKKGVPTLPMSHRWNGKETEPMARLARDRVVVSAFSVPADFKGDVIFSVHNAQGDVINQSTYVVTRGGMSLTAFEKLALIEQATAEPALPAATSAGDKKNPQKMEMDEMFIPTPHDQPAANPSAQKALDAAPVSEMAPVKAQAKQLAPKQQPAKAPERIQTHRSHKLLRLELHGVYAKQKDLGSGYTAVAYWAPELHFTPALGMGARLGGTQWKEKGEDKFFAFESDLHVNLTLDSLQGHITFQPLVGYHSWGDLGQQVSYGGNIVLQQANSSLSFILGAQAWKHEGVSYQWVNVGVGVEL